eukprot:749557-Hanusia_phi.AAC.4
MAQNPSASTPPWILESKSSPTVASFDASADAVMSPMVSTVEGDAWRALYLVVDHEPFFRAVVVVRGHRGDEEPEQERDGNFTVAEEGGSKHFDQDQTEEHAEAQRHILRGSKWQLHLPVVLAELERHLDVGLRGIHAWRVHEGVADSALADGDVFLRVIHGRRVLADPRERTLEGHTCVVCARGGRLVVAGPVTRHVGLLDDSHALEEVIAAVHASSPVLEPFSRQPEPDQHHAGAGDNGGEATTQLVLGQEAQRDLQEGAEDCSPKEGAVGLLTAVQAEP